MYQPQPSLYGPPPGMAYVPQPYTPPVSGNVNPGDISYGHLRGPDGRSFIQLFSAVAASYTTPQGPINGVQWTPLPDLVPGNLPPQGALPAHPEFVKNFVRTKPHLAGFISVPPVVQDPRQPESRKEKKSKHNRGGSDLDALQKAREQDRRSSYQNPTSSAGGAVAFPGSVPAGYPAYGTYPPFGEAAKPQYVPWGQPIIPGAYPDVSQQMAGLDLNSHSEEKRRERKTSDRASKRTRKQSTREVPPGAFDNLGYALPPMVYGYPPQPSSSTQSHVNPYGYPTSGSSQSSDNPSPNVPNPKDLGPYGAPPPGWHGNPHTASSSSSRHTRERSYSNAGRASTSPVVSKADVYPPGHILAGQSKSRAASPNPQPAYGYPQHAGSMGTPSPYHPPGVLPSGYPPSQAQQGAQSGASRPASRMGAPSPYHPPASLASGYPQSQPGGRPASRMASGAQPSAGPSPYNPNAPVVLPPENSAPLQAPECFSRPINAALPYFPFDPINVHDMDNFFKEISPKLPNVCETHDIRSDDWQRFIQDLSKAWLGKLPAHPLANGRAPHPAIIAEKVISTWNSSFFESRGIEVVIYRGIMRRSGPLFGRQDLKLNDLKDASDSDAETESSTSTDSEDEDPYGEDGSAVVGLHPELSSTSRKKYWEERAQIKQRRKERRERNKRRRLNKKYRLFITCVRDGGPQKPHPKQQSQSGSAPPPAAAPAFGPPQSSYPGMQWPGAMPPPSAKSHSRAPSRSGKY